MDQRTVYVYVEALLSPGLMKTHVPDGETEPRGGEKWDLVGNRAAQGPVSGDSNHSGHPQT